MKIIRNEDVALYESLISIVCFRMALPTYPMYITMDDLWIEVV